MKAHLFSHALPHFGQCFEWFTLLSAQRAVPPTNAFEQLLNGAAVPIQLEDDDRANAMLAAIYWEYRQEQKLFGTSALALGHPILLTKVEDQIRSFPLFTQTVEIKRTGGHSWEVSLSGNPIINPQFLTFWRDQTQDGSPELPVPELLNDPEYWQTFAETHELTFHREWTNRQFPNMEEIGELYDHETLIGSALIGFFSSLNQEETDLRPSLRTIALAPPVHTTRLRPLDPEQEAAIQLASTHNYAVWEASDRAKSSPPVLELIINNLLNERTTLLVSDTVQDGQDIYDELHRIGLGALAFNIRNAQEATATFKSLMNNLSTMLQRPLQPLSENFNFHLERAERSNAALNSAFDASNAPVWNQKSWTDLVGEYLSASSTESSELLGSILNAHEFEFTEGEYQQLLQSVHRGQSLYQPGISIGHPLEQLHPSIFLDHDKKTAHGLLAKKVEQSIALVQDLNQTLVKTINKAQRQLESYLQQHVLDQQKKSQELLNLIADLRNKYGADALIPSYALPLIRKISSSAQGRYDLRQRIHEQLEVLTANYTAQPHLNPPFQSGFNLQKLQLVEPELRAYLEHLKAWKNRIPGLVKDEILRLSTTFQHPAFPDTQALAQADLEYEQGLLALNNIRLLESTFPNDRFTLVQKQRQLEKIDAQLQTIDFQQRDFDNFYPWWKHWLENGLSGKRVLKGLLRTKPTYWNIAFESWYLYQVLQRTSNDNLPIRSIDLSENQESAAQVRSSMVLAILEKWRSVQKKLLQSANNVNEINAWFAREIVNKPLRKIWAEDLPIWKKIHPVLIITSTTLERWESAALQEMDHVILQERHPLSISHQQRILANASQITCVELRAHDYFDPAQFLARHMMNQNIPNHQWQAAVSAPQPTEIISCDGRYDEQEETNEIELLEIIKTLGKIELRKNRTYGRVLVLVGTKAQRNKLLNTVDSIQRKQLPGHAKLSQLARNGLFISSLEDPWLPKAESLILAITFGHINLQGKITAHIGALEKPNARALLASVSQQRWFASYLIHALPAKQELLRYLSDSHPILDWVSWQPAELPQEAAANQLVEVDSFLEEIKKRLEGYLDEDIMVYYQYNRHAQVGLGVLHRNELKALLLTEDFFSGASKTTADFETRCRNELQHAQVARIGLWSSEWLVNPEGSARAVASKILALIPPTTAAATSEEE